ncbi:hypothetical protein [Lentibacillus juripiscarius]|uniref:Uncharacterized protein n=1 Tax=Lentibacillus juripiscarius TaxID=257446 RepID=A0ABW5V9W5_9BACI
MLTVVLVVLAACGNSSRESDAKSNNESPDSSTAQNENGGSPDKGSKETENNKMEPELFILPN